jgi:TatD DNase family protein
VDQADDAGGGVAAALERSARAGVRSMVCVGTDADTSAQALALARAGRRGALGPGAPAVWATAGLHPHEAALGAASVAPLIEAAVAEADGALVAVGECGLDYFYEHSPRPDQRRAFAEQIGLAQRFGLTLVIHARDAWDDLFAVLGSEGVPRRTVLHCFTGGPAELERCLEAQMFVSFSGIVTFKNAEPVRQAAGRCPPDRLLVETDSPFLAPVPHRGRPNEPAYVPLVGAAVAEVRGVAPEVVAASSALAARQAFSL